MTTTPRLGLELIDDDEILGYVSANEALELLERLVQPTVIRRDLATPPGSPSEGDQYIVAGSPTGAWSGHATHIATYLGAAWVFKTPQEGWMYYDQTANEEVVFNSTDWVIFPGGGGGGGSGSMTSLGLNVAAPATGGQLAQTLAANNITGTLMKRFTDTSPTGKFVDYQTAAAGSLYSVSITGDVAAKTETLQPLSNGDALIVKNTAGGTTRFSVNTSVGDKIKAGNRLFVDTAAQFFDFGLGGSQIGWVDTTPPTPKAAALLVYSKTLGDSATTMGGSAIQATASDDSSVASGTRGQLIAVRAEVEPLILHDVGPNIDDVACITIENIGTHRGVDALYLSDRHASMDIAHPYDWNFGISIASWCEFAGIVAHGTYGTYGLDFMGPLNTGGGSQAGTIIRVPNNQYYVARNQANGANVNLFKLNTDNLFQIDTTTLLYSTSTTGAAVPLLKLRTGGTTGGNGGALDFVIQDNTPADVIAGRLRASLSDGTAGALDADLILSAMLNGTLTDRVFLYSSGAMSLNVSSDPGTAGWFRANRLLIRDTSAAYDVHHLATSSVTLTAPQGLTWDVQNKSHTLKLPSTDGTLTYPEHLGSAVTLVGTLSKTRPNETKDNSGGAASVDFSSVFTIPANMITTGTHLQVILDFHYVMSGSATTTAPYLKLGSTTVFTQGSVNLGNSADKQLAMIFHIYGTAAAGGSVNVEVSASALWANTSSHNTTATTTLATNGTLTVVPGITFGVTGGTDAVTLRSATIIRYA